MKKNDLSHVDHGTFQGIGPNPRLYGIIGILGIIGVGIGEFLMHYNELGYDSPTPFGYLKTIPQFRITVGHFLAIIFVPFYFVAYYYLYRILVEARLRLARLFFFSAIFIFSLGAVWIGSRAVLAVMVKGDFTQGIEAYQQYSESLLQGLRVGLLFISFLFSYIVWTGKTRLPKWMAFFNPAVFLTLILAICMLLPSVGNVLVPTAMNVAHVGFLGLTLYITYQTNEN